MWIEEMSTKKTLSIEIIPVNTDDYLTITESQFWFNWEKERAFDVYKLRIRSHNILGLLSLKCHPEESRIEIRLLAVSKENRGRKKKFDHVAGNLIAFACIKAITLFGEWACVSLVPKTQLINHYMMKYEMVQAGQSLFTDGRELIKLIRRSDHD